MNTNAAPGLFPAGPQISTQTFEKFRALILETTGIHMRDGKQILVANRLRRRLTDLSISTYEEYFDYLTGGHRADEMARFVDAVSTNETYFFREEHHFRVLESTILPELFREYGALRIWSAGCSSGEEVYSLRIVADRAARAAGAPLPEITGTDLSTTMVERAREATYGERALRLVPRDIRDRYFVDRGGGAFQVRDDERSRVQFRVHNLFVDAPPWRSAHLIFCRNVMIYFDKKTQARLVDGIFAQALSRGGYLFIGHSESLSGFTQRFSYAADLKAPIYRLSPEGFT